MKRERIICFSIIALLFAALLTVTVSSLTSGAFSQRELSRFDLNDDRNVDIKDVSVLLNFLAGNFGLPDLDGLIAEEGGIRLYENNVYKTGFCEYGGRTMYFYPENGYMAGENFALDGKSYIVEPFVSNDLNVFSVREAKQGFVPEDGGIRHYVNDEMTTGWLDLNGQKLYFDPATGLMRTDELTVGENDYFAPTPFTCEGLTLYAYGDPIPEPRVNTAAWAAYISENGGSVRVPDLQMPAGDLYTVGHNGASQASPWENWNGNKFRFLVTFDTDRFPIDFSNDAVSPYTWYIWYKDSDDASADWRLCVTKPDSTYGWSSTRCLFRVPTYAGGMTDLHTNNGARNDYEFVIAIYRDADCSLVCFCDQKNVPVTDAYEMNLADALSGGSDMGGQVDPLPLPGFEIPSTGVLALAPDGSGIGTPDGRNPSIADGQMTVFFNFMNTGTGLDLGDDCVISYSVTRQNGSVISGSAPLDRDFVPILTENGYIGLRFDLGLTPDLYESVTFDLSFADRGGKTYTLSDKSFKRTISFMGLDRSAFAALAAKGISADVRDDTVFFSGDVNGHTYHLELQLAKWAGLTKAAQVVECAALFFDVYPPMYERFGEAGGSPDSVTLAIENEGYGIASTGGDFVHLHDAYLYNNKYDYDCLTHEFAHVIQYGWDGNYCEVSGYIEEFADAARFLYATEGGRYNDLGWSIGAENSGSTRTSSIRFLLWMDYFYSTEDNDLLLKFFTACKNKRYRRNNWAAAWTQIFSGSELEGKTADEAYALYLSSDFASLSTLNFDGVSPLLAKYDVRAKAGRAYSDPAFALFFPVVGSEALNNYTSTWYATVAGQTWELVNFNNINNKYAYIKCGAVSGGSASIRTTSERALGSFTVDLGNLKTAAITGISLIVSRGEQPLVTIPLTVKKGRQTVFIPEEFRETGLTYTFEFITTSTNVNGAVILNRIIAHPAGSVHVSEDEPQINTAAWAEFVSKNGSGLYADFEQRRAGLYHVTHDGANDGCAWENGGSPSQLQFLCKLGNAIFDLRYTGSSPSYSWTIWYKDADDPADSFRSIVTKPWSTYDFGGDTLYRVPTYRDGMTDLHTDGGKANVYEFIIVVTDDATGELICWTDLSVSVTDSYEMYESEQAI